MLGAERVTEELSATLGVRPGETTGDGAFTLMEVECLGACDRAPVVMVNDNLWHERLAPEQVGPVRRRPADQGRRRRVTGCHLQGEKKMTTSWPADLRGTPPLPRRGS